MMKGTVSDVDARTGVGIIDADDGRIVFFNDANLRWMPFEAVHVGTRVLFADHEADCGPHADIVMPST